ncbi:2-oxoglutarate carboxylase small subunit [Legionella maceachernii]|nr:2-oxoglutarate carboxylase small subunit [Legionella maceachernii]
MVIKAAKTSGYTNAGTVEFIVDEARQIYFLNKNKKKDL